MTPGVFEGVHFSVQDGAAALHPAVVAATDDSPVVNEDGADRDSSLSEPCLGLFDGRRHEWIRRVHGVS
jgi:hypothetical protein